MLDFLLRHGYWVLFLNILAEQMAIPIPATPALLAMGALIGAGKFSFPAALCLATLACLMCDQVWYRLGRVRGHAILRFICRVSLEPDSCVSNTKGIFARWGAWTLLFAKFVPGLSTVAAPMAGLTRMSLGRFLLADFCGALIWTGGTMTAGYVFRNQLERVVGLMGQFGQRAGFAILLLLAYVGWKVFQRRRFLAELKISRVSPEELQSMIESSGDVVVIDLRDALDVEYAGVKIPGAKWIAMPELEARRLEIPKVRELILYCS